MLALVNTAYGLRFLMRVLPFFFVMTAGCWIALWSDAQSAPPLQIEVAKSGTAKVRPNPLPNFVQQAETMRRTPGAAITINQTAWAKQRAATVKEIVDYTPGVFAQPRNGAESARLSIRGSGLARSFQGRGLLVLQDNIPINTADGGFEFLVIDPWLIQSAEIYRGANGQAFGTSALGGAINFNTPTGQSDQRTTVRVEGGGFHDRHGMVAKGWQGKNGHDAYGAVTGFAQGGFRDNNQTYTTRLNGNAGWQTNQDLAQRLYINVIHTNVQIPGALSKAEIVRDPSQVNPVNVRGHYQRNLDIARMGHRAVWQDGPQQVESTLYVDDRYLDNPVTTYIKEHNNDIGWRGKYTRDWDLNRLTLGVNTAYGTGEEHRYTNIAGRTGTHILERDLQATTHEAFAQYDQHLISALYGVVGAQGTYAERNLSETFPRRQHQDRHYVGFNPRVGLRYDLDYAMQIFSNVSRSFEPPTWDELSNGNAPGFQSLKAQTADSAEIGLRRSTVDTQWEATYYRAWLHNEFVNYQFASGTTSTINADQSVHEGVELGLTQQLRRDTFVMGDGFTGRIAYSWNHFHLVDDPIYGDNQLPGVPVQYVRSELLYHHPSGVSFGPNVEWVPVSSPVDLTHSLKTDPYAVVGARADWDVPQTAINLYIEGRNLADKHYIATNNVIPNANGVDGRYFYPGEGRTVYAGLRVQF